MQPKTSHIARLMLFVLLGTFLMPSFAWQMVVSHEQAEHSQISQAMHDDTHAHHDDTDQHHHDDENAHSQIGHLLSHMPLFVQSAWALPQIEKPRTFYPVRISNIFQPGPDRPFKPPIAFLFI